MGEPASRPWPRKAWVIAHKLRITKASVIAPFHYLQIIFAVFYGYLVFNNLPDLLTIAGSVVISLAGIAICWLEIRASKPDRA